MSAAGKSTAGKSAVGKSGATRRRAPARHSDTFDFVVKGVPRVLHLKLGNKGEVEVDLSRIPQEVLGPDDEGILIKSIRRLLINTLSGEPSLENAQELIEAWYVGARTRREAKAMAGRFETGARIDDYAAASRAFEAMRDMAAKALGDEEARHWSRQQLKRRLGKERFATMEKLANELVGGK